jgi:hypothetical protein
MDLRMRREKFVHLVYIDDSSLAKKRQVLGAVILKDAHFGILEGYLGYTIGEHVPEELQLDFEFHSSELYCGSGPFQTINEKERLQLLNNCIAMIAQTRPAIAHASVEIDKLQRTNYASAIPIDVAFRALLPEVERWFSEKDPTGLGIVICDDTTDKVVKQQMQNTFRENRPRVKALVERGEKGEPVKIIENRGKLKHIHDAMYFGNSAHSAGLQCADVCSWLILRHLKGDKDTEHWYKKIEPLIYSEWHEPK